MDRPLIEDGAVVVRDGAIMDVAPAAQAVKTWSPADVQDLGDVVLVPGLVNPHTHLELSNCTSSEPPRGATVGTSFVDWIRSMSQRLGRERFTPEQIFPAATRRGIEQCLRFGVTTVGDISNQMHLTRPVLRKSPLRCVSYGEVLGLARRRPRLDEMLPLAMDRSLESDRLIVGLSPHAPYTVDLHGFRQCLALARQDHLPLATHLAEVPDESDFLVHHRGPFREIWETLGQWSDDVPTYPGPPIAFAEAIGLLDHPTLLAHVNYASDEEIGTLARGRASVVYCPRTHAYFGHPPHRWREMLSAGVNVAVGTDSCASSPDLNPIEELRLLHRLAPEVPPRDLWEMVTWRAAKAVTLEDRVGSISVGKRADFVSFAADRGDPLRQVLEQDVLPTGVWIDGQPTIVVPKPPD